MSVGTVAVTASVADTEICATSRFGQIERNLHLIEQFVVDTQRLLDELNSRPGAHTLGPVGTPSLPYSALLPAEARTATQTAMLLSPKQVATQIGVNTKKVYRAIEKGELAAVRIGNRLRIEPADLDRWFERGRVRTDTNSPLNNPMDAPPQRRIRQLLDQRTKGELDEH